MSTLRQPAAGLKQNGLDSESELVSINVTPLVDITLVLLIIFMVTSSLVLRETVEVDFPRPAAGASRTPVLLSIVMNEDSTLLLDGAEVSEAELRKQVVLAIGKDKQTGAVVSAHKSVSYGKVVRLIDAIKGDGVERFVLNIQSQRR